MSFDLSRIRFDARKDFLGVVMQQGRVQLDADWNEWVAQLSRRLQAGTLDTFGGTVVPRTTPDGFRIEAAGGGLSIGPGRIYVDGLLAENHGAPPNIWDPQLAGLAGSAPVAYDAQPYYPNPEALPAGGPHLVYVDVWQREVTALQAPALIEQAVGVDTTGRLQTVWQVKLLPNVGNADCSTPDENLPGWVEATRASGARLSTATGVPDFEPDPCEVPPAAGYRGLENQLYRVEVHTGGAPGTATFKWSRDNATVASRVTHINPARDRLVVQSVGRDDHLRFNNGDWVEVTDDWRELHQLPGVMCRIRVADGVNDNDRSIRFEPPLPAGLFPTNAQQATDAARNTRVRRWDHSDAMRFEDGAAAPGLDDGAIPIPPAGQRLFLEHGILVDFSLAAGGEFRSGDYWVFAARSADASIEVLASAPPRGIHHHYARLAMVSFPDAETDCRTLWPPLHEGGHGCDCTVCVSAEAHNSGTATLQQAIDSIKAQGGTVCLGIGIYHLREPVSVDDARSIRIRGQGWATILLGDAPGTVLDIRDATGVALENLSAIGSNGDARFTPVVAVTNVIDFRADHINVLGLGTADASCVGIGLSGIALGATVSDCAIVADVGIGALTSTGRDLPSARIELRSYLLTGELRVQRNLLFCRDIGVALSGECFHFGNTRIADNLMLAGRRCAVLATGTSLPGSPVSITDNMIYTRGDGIRAGLDRLAVERNEITAFGEASGSGIVIVEGLDPEAIEALRIDGNRLGNLSGDGIGIEHALADAAITGNRMHDIGGAALAMGEGARAQFMRISGNHWERLGLELPNPEQAYAAVQLIAVERLDMHDNLIAGIAPQATAHRAIDGVRLLGGGQLRFAANRMFAVGPPQRAAGQIAALRVVPPFERLIIDDNHIERGSNGTATGELTQWHAILVVQNLLGDYLAPAAVIAGANAIYYLLTPTRIRLLRASGLALSIRGNQIRGDNSLVPIVECGVAEHCLFADNHCSTSGQTSVQPQLASLHGRTLNASNNRLSAPGDMDTLHLHMNTRGTALVIGNTSSGNIRVINGVPAPADMSLTNIIAL